MEDRAPGAIYRSRILARQQLYVQRVGFVGDVHVRQTFPSLANANHVAAHFTCAVYDGLNDWIQTWNVTPPVKMPIFPPAGIRFPPFVVAMSCCSFTATAYVSNVPELGQPIRQQRTETP